MLILLIAGIAGGATSALYLAYNYPPITAKWCNTWRNFCFTACRHMFFIEKLNMHAAGLYLAAALPAHLAIHFTTIG